MNITPSSLEEKRGQSSIQTSSAGELVWPAGDLNHYLLTPQIIEQINVVALLTLALGDSSRQYHVPISSNCPRKLILSTKYAFVVLEGKTLASGQQVLWELVNGLAYAENHALAGGMTSPDITSKMTSLIPTIVFDQRALDKKEICFF
mgnify:CR=1 FL=1